MHTFEQIQLPLPFGDSLLLPPPEKISVFSEASFSEEETDYNPDDPDGIGEEFCSLLF